MNQNNTTIASTRTDYSFEEIQRYYRDTRWQYYALWTGSQSLALHYGFWDETTENSTEALHKMNAVLADSVQITDKDLILDAGCGWGGSTIWLRQNRGCSGVGINIDGEQVAKAWKKAEEQGLTQWLNFLRMDYHETVFADGVFDVVWALESVCHSRDKGRFLKEAHRLLKPGGRLVIAEYFRSGRDLSPEQETPLRAWLDQWVIEDLATANEFGSLAAEAGFESIDIKDITEHITPSANDMAGKGRRLASLAKLFNRARRLLPMRWYTDMSHANWKASLLQSEALNSGAWTYGICTAKKKL